MKDIFTHLLKKCRESKHANWYLASIFSITIFLQCCLFHYLALHSILISSLWKNPLAFWSFYLPKMSISVFVASFVFLFKRKGWTIVVSILINIWIIAELIYSRANRIFLDAHSFTLISNMDGFWSSIPLYLQGLDWILLVPTIIWVVAFYCFYDHKKSDVVFVIALIFSILLHIGGCLGIYYVYNNLHNLPTKQQHINPFSDEAVNDLFGFTSLEYIRNMSVVHAFIYDVKKLIQMPFERTSYDMTEEDVKQALFFINTDNQVITPTNNLIIILVESLETWAIRPEITPNLYSFIQNHNVIWSQRVTSQTKGGTSSDGQFILNTGLLPIQKGAICKRYPQNKFPSLSQIYSSAALIQAGDMSIWNQKYMSEAYHIDTNYLSPQSLDHYTFEILDRIYTEHSYVLTITMATHSPFLACSKYTSIDLPEDMPQHMANYLRCMNYSDSCWGKFLQKVDRDSTLKNSVICFQGDHIIFDSNMRNDFEQYCLKNNLDYDVQNNHTAFIAYSPKLEEKTIVTNTSYQMDAYPTILHLIGCEDYCWKGFGVNLLDSIARNNRLITEQEAFSLSDKIIRANWFETLPMP